MPTCFHELHQRLSDPLLRVLTLAFVPAVRDRTDAGRRRQRLVMLPAAFLYSRNLLTAGPIAVAIALVVAAALLNDSATWPIAGIALSGGGARCFGRRVSLITAWSARSGSISP